MLAPGGLGGPFCGLMVVAACKQSCVNMSTLTMDTACGVVATSKAVGLQAVVGSAAIP